MRVLHRPVVGLERHILSKKNINEVKLADILVFLVGSVVW